MFLILYSFNPKYMVMDLLLGLLNNLASSLGHGVGRSRLTSSLRSLKSLSSDVLGRSQFSILLLHGSIGVKLEHRSDVLERIGPDNSMHDLLDGSPGHLPDGLALQQDRQVSVSHLGLGQVPPSLGSAGLAPSAVQAIKVLEGRLSPDAEPSHVASGGELQQVQVVHLHGVNSWDVPECLGNSLILIVDDERSQLLDTSPVPQLSLTSPHTPGGVHLGHIGPGLVLPQEHHGLLGLGEGLDLVSHDQRNLWNALDLMTLGHDQSRDTSGSDGRADGVPLLGGVDLPVPPPPGLGGGEHATSTAHVSVSSLARSLGTTTLHPGDTSHSTSSSPRLGTSLVTNINVDSIGLPLVLGHVVVDPGHDVRPHWGPEHSWKAHGTT